MKTNPIKLPDWRIAAVVLAIIITAAGIFGWLALPAHGDDSSLWRWFDLDRELNLTTFFSAGLLLVNAWLAVKDEAKGRILITSSVDEGWVYLSVEDNGSGVPEELREGLFDAFVSTRSEIEGLGLGLAISRQFMETMGGELRLVEAGRLGGARFLLKMPTPKTVQAGMETAL